MLETQKLVLETGDGNVIRTFLLPLTEAETSGHVVRRSDTRRLEIVANLESLYQQKIKFNELGQIRRENLDHLDFVVPGVGRIKAAAPELRIVKDPVLHDENRRIYTAVLALTILSFAGLLTFLGSRAVNTDKLDEKIKQEVVQIMKRITPKTVTPKVEATLSENRATEKPQVVKTAGVKRMGALGVLGSLSHSTQKGGLNLGAAQTSAGPGLGGTAGSGGVQTNIYAKGLVAAPLGVGGNIQGAGGYGTKGKGGGQAGYGSTSLIGSTGGTSVPLTSEATVGGGLDKDAIAAVIAKNLGQVRFCYEQGLQGEPGLNGRVAVGFTIGANGLVKSAAIESSSLASKIVEECVMMRLKSWKFPLPENGVDVKVSYPFVLRRAGQG